MTGRSSGLPVLVLPPVILLLAGFVLPLAALVARAAAGGPGSLITVPLADPLFVAALWRTAWFAVVVSTLTLVVGTAYALALVLAPTWLRVVLAAVLVVTFWVSLLVRTYAWVITLQPAGALDWVAAQLHLPVTSQLYQTLPGLFAPMVHVLLPYVVLPVRSALRGVDPARIRTARSLGAGEWLTVRRVLLPELWPGMAAGLLLVVILSLGFYVTPAFLGGPGTELVAGVIGTHFGRMRDLEGACAMGLFLLVVVLGLYWIADRWVGLSERWAQG